MANDTQPRMTLQTITVLSQFIDSRKALSGADIVNTTGMLTGTLYPILRRLEDCGWLESEWEDIDPIEAGRPRKRLYKITPFGRTNANCAIASLRRRLPDRINGGSTTKGKLAWKGS